VGFRVVRPEELEWIERAPDGGGPARHVAGLTDAAGFKHTRANLWRYEPGAKGRRHKDMVQEETFVVVSGTLTAYMGDPPERVEVPTPGLLHVEPETPLQLVNEGSEELVLYAYGAPPETGNAEFLDSVV
jgi:mannose-6-phosphate isomerase-like protein (cupin superfamily)